RPSKKRNRNNGLANPLIPHTESTKLNRGRQRRGTPSRVLRGSRLDAFPRGERFKNQRWHRSRGPASLFLTCIEIKNFSLMGRRFQVVAPRHQLQAVAKNVPLRVTRHAWLQGSRMQAIWLWLTGNALIERASDSICHLQASTFCMVIREHFSNRINYGPLDVAVLDKQHIGAALCFQPK